MKKILTFFTAAVLLLSFAACGDGTASDTTDTGETTEVSHIHEWSDWEIEKIALVGKAGEEKRTCAVCFLSETRERTQNAIANSFYDNGLQQVFLFDGEITARGMLEYASHEFYDFWHKATPTATVFAALSERFDFDDALVTEMINIDPYLTACGESVYGYDPTDDTFTLEYQGERGECVLLGYIHISDDQYTVYYSFSSWGIEPTTTLWKVELVYNKINGTPNKYRSFERITATPDDMIECPGDQQSESFH